MYSRGFFGMLAMWLLASSFGARAGELGVQGVESYVDWKPSDCSPPSEPYFSCYDEYSCKSLVGDYNSYVDELSSYKRCVVGEANSDVIEFKSAVDKGVREAHRNADEKMGNSKDSLRLELEANGFQLD